MSPLPPWYFEKAGKKVPIETSDDDCATERNNRANSVNKVTSAGFKTHSKAGYYEMKKEPRGVCIIINNTFEKYDSQSHVILLMEKYYLNVLELIMTKIG